LHIVEFGVFIQIGSRNLPFRSFRKSRNPNKLITLKNELRMSLYITAASNGLIVHPLDHRLINMEHQQNDI
jgi:hypothetical protein